MPKSFPFSGQCNKIGVLNPDFVLDRPGGRSLHNGCNFHLSALDYGNGDGIQYTYDGKGRLICQTYEDGVTVTYQYDNDGALTSVTDSSSGITTRYFYDYTGRATKYTETGEDYSHTVAYTYNSDNNLSQLVETVNGTTYTTSYTYDKDNRITAKTTNGITEEYTYDALGRLTQQVIKNGDAVQQTKTYTYKSGTSGTSSQIATYTVASGAYSVTYTYQYDDNGNIISISDGSSLLTYAYDSANQIIRENTTSDDYTKVWTYDNAGNILTATEYDYSTGALGAQRDQVQYGYGDDSWGDLLTAFDGTQITYDEIGNPLTKGSTTYTWEHGRQLKSLSDGGETWTYTYNSDGLRTGRTNGQRTYTYVYSGSQLTQMTVDGYTLEFGYDANGTPLTLRFDDTLYYYITNIQGDVIGIQSVSGEKVLIYEYSAWGQVLYTNFADIPLSLNPLRYRGYVYDVETDLYYLQSRYYDPQIGRFLNADDYPMTGQGLSGNNMFAYCGNNPVLRNDAGGFFWHIAIGAAVGALVSGVAKVASNITHGKSLTSGLGTAIVSGAASGALSSTGVGLIGSIAGNAAISMGENVINQVIENKGFNNLDVGDVLVDGAVGAISGAIGGPGRGSKHLTNLGKQTVKRTLKSVTNHGVKQGFQEARKSFAYYQKHTVKFYRGFLKRTFKDLLTSTGINILSSK